MSPIVLRHMLRRTQLAYLLRQATFGPAQRSGSSLVSEATSIEQLRCKLDRAMAISFRRGQRPHDEEVLLQAIGYLSLSLGAVDRTEPS